MAAGTATSRAYWFHTQRFQCITRRERGWGVPA